MPLDKVKFNVKIFSIDRNHYQLKGKAVKEVIETIKENHKIHLRASETDLSIVKPTLKPYIDDDFELYTYCYNQPKQQNYWKLYLPDELIKDDNFEITEFSFVLFLILNSNIYCIIGGSGINVIKKYVNPYFGIDLYQHFAKPEEDIILGLSTRGVAGNISQKSHTYSFIQSINDSLEFSEIPKKLRVIVRDELKNGIFKNYDLNKEKAIMEIGSYFSLKKKINYDELKNLIKDIHKVTQDKSNYTQLTLFKKITDDDLIKDLDNTLLNKIIDDVVLHNTPDELDNLNNDIIEIVHPDKLELFYECDSYKLRFRNSRGKDDIIINNMSNIYFYSTQKIYKTLSDISDRNEIRKLIFDLQIVGQVTDNDKTFGNLYKHITAEILNNGSKYFRVDEQWYMLEDKFIEKINNEAKAIYSQNKLKTNLLNKWIDGNEDQYNNTHKADSYYVFDKQIKENVELCDILIIRDGTIYLVHVKNGFNTHMRNLYNQVILSANRLWNDINNTKGSSYLINTINKYNSSNPSKELDGKQILKDIVNDKLKIEFVMAYRNNSKKNATLTSEERIHKSNSNIAKYCVIQTVREIRAYRKFGISVIDITEVK